MKGLKLSVLIVFATVGITAFSQKTIEELSYEQCQSADYFQTVKNGTLVNKYIAANGAPLSVGDTLIIGVPSGTTTSTTIGSASGDVFGVGKANSRSKQSFSTIVLGKPAGFGNVMNAMAGETPNNAGMEMQGEIVVIAEMTVAHKGSKKKPLAMNILLGESNGRAFGVNKYLSIQDFEKSVLAGEIKSLNAPLTRDQAIAKLKESKDLVELGLMDKEQYEEIKSELTPIIMKN